MQPKKRVTFEHEPSSELQANFLSKLKVKSDDEKYSLPTPRIEDIYKMVKQLQSDVEKIQQHFDK